MNNKPNKNWLTKDTQKSIFESSKEVIFPLNQQQIKIVDKMVSYIDVSFNNDYKKYDIRPGIGIAACQLGLNDQLIYIHLIQNNNEYKYLLANPKIIKESAQICYISTGEGCLSVDNDHKGIIPRKYRVIVEAFDVLNKQPITITAEGLLSICLQHEVDHLQGKLYYHRLVKDSLKDWISIEH